jgi:hypothetical protein
MSRTGIQRGNRVFEGHWRPLPCTQLHPFCTRALTSWTTGCINSVVEVLDPRRQCSQSHRSCVSSPSDGHSGSSTGNAAAMAFAFLGRCFVGWACESIAKPDLCREITGRVCAGRIGRKTWGRAQVEARHHGTAAQAAPQSAVTPQGGNRRSKWANVVAAPKKAMALCEPRRQRPCHRDRNEQATQNHARLAHDTGAWKWNVDPLGAVALAAQSRATGGRKGTWDASGLAILCFLIASRL